MIREGFKLKNATIAQSILLLLLKALTKTFFIYINLSDYVWCKYQVRPFFVGRIRLCFVPFCVTRISARHVSHIKLCVQTVFISVHLVEGSVWYMLLKEQYNIVNANICVRLYDVTKKESVWREKKRAYDVQCTMCTYIFKLVDNFRYQLLNC